MLAFVCLLVFSATLNLPGARRLRITTIIGKAGVTGVTNGFGPDAAQFARGITIDEVGSLVIVDWECGDSTDGGASSHHVCGKMGVAGTTDGTGGEARFGADVVFVPGVTVPAGVVGSILPLLRIHYRTPRHRDRSRLVVDAANTLIRAIAGGGSVTTIAGAPQPLPSFFTDPNAIPTRVSTDGPGIEARFRDPRGVTAAGDTLYVTDGNAIRRIAEGNVVSTFAGIADTPGDTNGERLTARFRAPSGIVADRTGNLFVVDSLNFAIRKISTDGIVTTLAGSPGEYGSVDGAGAAARFVGQP